MYCVLHSLKKHIANIPSYTVCRWWPGFRRAVSPVDSAADGGCSSSDASDCACGACCGAYCGGGGDAAADGWSVHCWLGHTWNESPRKSHQTCHRQNQSLQNHHLIDGGYYGKSWTCFAHHCPCHWRGRQSQRSCHRHLEKNTTKFHYRRYQGEKLTTLNKL